MAYSYNNIAQVYKKQVTLHLEYNTKLASACMLFLMNTSTADGHTFHLQGRYDRALPLFQKSVEIFKKALGPNHPNVAVVQRDLDSCLHAMGEVW